jgi:hypothetical protein
MRKTSSAYCPTCGKQTLHAKEGISNLLHLVLTILTAGLWLLVWIFLAVKSGASRMRCQTCGTKHTGFARAPEQPQTPEVPEG